MVEEARLMRADWGILNEMRAVGHTPNR